MIWKDIEGYEGDYKVNMFGEVYSNKTSKILKNLLDKRGYLSVNLYRKGKMKRIKVHRLVAKAFIPNPCNNPEINHLDGDKQNNCMNNLEWVTGSQNMKHAYEKGLQKPSENQKKHVRNLMIDINNKKKRAVIKYDEEMNFIERYESVTEASMSINNNSSYISDISKCCRGKVSRCKGFIWKYEDE